jgi:hypothetical protein
MMAPWQERLLLLNRRQTRALLFGLFMFVFMGLYPPWEHMFMNEVGGWFDRPAGFHWILTPPDLYNTPTYMGATVNWTQLFIQWGVVGVITLIFIWGLKDRLQDDLPLPPGHARKTHF